MQLTGYGNFIPAPEGFHVSILVDVVDLGKQTTNYGDKFMVKLVYQIDEDMESGKPFIVSGRFNATLSERSSLRKHIQGLRGKAFTKEELEGFDPESLIGTNAILNIVHNEGKQGGLFANIDTVLPYDKKFGDKLTARDYEREQDRKDFGTTSE